MTGSQVVRLEPSAAALPASAPSLPLAPVLAPMLVGSLLLGSLLLLLGPLLLALLLPASLLHAAVECSERVQAAAH